MFEGTVVWALNKYLGEYVEKFDKSMLSISMMKGEVELKDLTLSPSALKQLNLPITIAWGRLGKLNISLSWSKLLSRPLVLEIDEIYLLAESITDMPYDAELEAAREDEVKSKLIEAMEAAAAKPDAADLGDTAKTQFRILNNVQVVIKRIHIRYEDHGGGAGSPPFACGFMLQELSARSATAGWEICELGEDDAVARKRLLLDGLAIYWACEPPKDTFCARAKPDAKLNFCRSSFGNSRFDYLIKPISADGRVQINKQVKSGEDGKLGNPRHEIAVDLKPIAIDVNNLQYTSVLGFADHFAWLAKRAQYRHLRPVIAVSKNAGTWWKFAFESLMIDVRRRTKPWTPEFINARRANRLEYERLFEPVADDKSPSSDEQARLEAIESEQTAEDIFSWRTRVRTKLAIKKAKAKADKKNSSWFGWGKKKKKKKGGEEEEEEEVEPDMSEEARKFRELFQNETAYEDGDSLEWVGATVKLTIAEISASLFEIDRAKRGAMGYKTEILHVGFQKSTLALSQRPVAGAMKVDALLGQLFLQMVRHDGSFADVVKPLATRGTSSVLTDESTALRLLFETKPIVDPLEVAPDVRLKLAVRPVELYVTAPGAKRVTSFFGTGNDVETGDIGNLYSDAAMQFQSQSLAGLINLAEERSVMDLEITVEAPIIVLPAKDDAMATTLALILDLGVLELNSILDSTDGVDPERQLSTVEAAREQAYDRFDIKLTKVQVLLTRRGELWREALSTHDSPMHLLDQTDFQLILQKALTDYDTKMPTFKVEGALPRLRVRITSLQISNLIRLGDSLATEFAPEDPGSTAGAPLAVAGPNASAGATSTDGRANEANISAATGSGDQFQEHQKRVRDKRMIQALNQVLDLAMRVEETEVVLAHDSGQVGGYTPIVRVKLTGMSVTAKTKKWDQELKFGLSGVAVTGLVDTPVDLVHAYGSEGADFVGVDLLVCDDASPLFEPRFDNTKLRVKVVSEVIEIVADQASLISTLQGFDKIASQIKSEVKKGIAAVAASEASDATSGPAIAASQAVATPKGLASVTDIDGSFTFGKLVMRLQQPSGPLMRMEVAALQATFVTKASGSMRVVADLQNLELVNAAAPAGSHAQIVSIVTRGAATNLFHVEFDDFGEEVDGTTGKLVARVGELQCVCLLEYVYQITAYVDPITAAMNPLQAEVNKVREDYMAAVASKMILSDEVVDAQIRETVEMLTALVPAHASQSVRMPRPSIVGPVTVPEADDEAAPTKIQLDVSLDAPFLIVPASPSSSDGIGLKLGSLSASNAFSATDFAQTDSMAIALVDVNVAKVSIDPATGKVIPLRKLFWIEQIDVDLDRCIQYKMHAWDTRVPLNMVVVCAIGSVNMNLHQPDLAFLMGIADGNLAAEPPAAAAGALSRAESLESLNSMNSTFDPSDQDLDDGFIPTSPTGLSPQGGAFDNLTCPAPAGNGMSVKLSISSVALGLLKETLDGKVTTDLAQLAINGISLEHVVDSRGIEDEAVNVGIKVGTTRARIHDMIIYDRRESDLGDEARKMVQTTPTNVAAGVGDTAAAGDLLDVTIVKRERALQIVGVAPKPGAPPSPFVPLHPQVVAELCSRFGTVEGVYAGGDGSVKTATVQFDTPLRLRDAMGHMYLHKRAYNAYIQHANWEPESADTKITAHFQGLQTVASAEFIKELQTFVDMDAAGGESAKVDAVATSTGPHAPERPTGRQRVCHLRNWDCNLEPTLNIKFTADAKATVAEDIFDANGHRITAAISASGNIAMQGKTTVAHVRLRQLEVESGTANGAKQKIIPNLDLSLMAKQVGDTHVRATVSVGVLELSASVEDLNLLARIQKMLGLDDAAAPAKIKTWSPAITEVPEMREIVVASKAGPVCDEQAFVDVGVINFVLIDTSRGRRVPLVIASIGARLEAQHWSSNLHADATVTIAVSAFDEDRSTWHPLVIANPTERDEVRPVVAHITVQSPETEWLPALSTANQITIKCSAANRGSAKPATSMLDSNPTTYWDAGGKNKNYAVFDFGMPVKLFGFRYSCVNLQNCAPKNCELYIGSRGGVNAKDWKKVATFQGPSNDDSGAPISFSSEPISARGRFLKWVIRSRHGRGSAKVISVGFEVRGEGSIQQVAVDSGIELSLPSATMLSLQRAGSNIVFTGSGQKHLDDGLGDVHQVWNQSRFKVAVTGGSAGATTQVVASGDHLTVELMADGVLRRPTARGVKWDTSTHPNPSGKNNGEGVEMQQFLALARLVEDDTTHDAKLILEVEGWHPVTVVGLATVPSVQYVTLTARSQPTDVRLAISLTMDRGVKQISLSSPSLLANRTELPLEISYNLSSSTDTVDQRLAPGETAGVELGHMDSIVDEALVPLYRFENTHTGKHFYTTNTLDIEHLGGSTWEQESILGFMFLALDGYTNVNNKPDSALELWGSIPTTYRPVSTLQTQKCKGSEPDADRTEKMAKRGLRLLGYVYAYSDTLATRPQFVAIRHDYNEAVDDSSFYPDTLGGKDHAFILTRSPGMLRVRPGPSYQWSTGRFYPRQTPTGQSVHLLSTPSTAPGQAPFVCALRNTPATARWTVRPLLGTKNALPYPIYCGLTDSADDVPDHVQLIKPGEQITMAINKELPVKGSFFLRVSLQVPDDVAAGHATVAPGASYPSPPSWGTAVPVATFGGATPIGSCPTDMPVSFKQRGVEHNLLLRLRRTVSDTSNVFGCVSVHCPYIVYNETARDIDVFSGSAESYSSLWRPETAGFASPGLFSPAVGFGSFEAVTFAMYGMASPTVALYEIDGVRTLKLSKDTLGSHKEQALISDLLVKKVPQQPDDAFNLDDDDFDLDSATVTTSWQYADSQMLSRHVYIRSCFIVRNLFTEPLIVLRKPRTDPAAFQLFNNACGCFLHSSKTPLPSHGQNEVTGTDRNCNTFWRISYHQQQGPLNSKLLLDARQPIVTYGAAVQLTHRSTDDEIPSLHSHPRKHASGTKQQQVTGYKWGDTDWAFMPPRLGLIDVGAHTGSAFKTMKVPDALKQALALDGSVIVSSRPANQQDTYPDVFVVEINGDELVVRRTDFANGWGQNLVLEYYSENAGDAVQNKDTVRLLHTATGGYLCMSAGTMSSETKDQLEVSCKYATYDSSRIAGPVATDADMNWNVSCLGKSLLAAHHVQVDNADWSQTQIDVDRLEPDFERSTEIAPGGFIALTGAPGDRKEWYIETLDGERSSVFDPSAPGVQPVLRLNTKTHGFLPLEVFITSSASTTTVEIRPPALSAPYRFENRCGSYVMYVSQRGTLEAPALQLKPNMMASWAPFDATLPGDVLKLMVELPSGDGTSELIHVDSCDLSSPDELTFTIGEYGKLYAVTYTDEATQVVVFCTALSTARMSCGLTPSIPPEVFISNARVQVPWVGVSLIDSAPKHGDEGFVGPREVMYIRVSGLDAGLATTSYYKKISFIVDDLQLDYSSRSTYFPVLLGRQVQQKSSKAGTNREPFVKLMVATKLAQCGGKPHVDVHEYIGLLVQEIVVQVDRGMLVPLLNYVSALAATDEFTKASAKSSAASQQVVSSGREIPVDFHKVEIHPLKIRLDVIGNVDEDFPHAIFINQINLKDFTIHLPSIELENERMPFGELTTKTTGIMKKEVVKYMLRMGVLDSIFSIGFLGDTKSMLTTFGGGFKQALYDPAEAALKGDGDFGKVLGQGAIGLGQGLAGGTVGLVSNVTKRTGSILATLTFDKEFQDNRESELKKTTGVVDGVATGAKQFGKGLAGGLTGVFLDPLKGAKKGGAVGFLKGIGTGVAGLAFKPIAGTVDLVSSSMAGVESAVGPKTLKFSAVRPIRRIEPTGLVTPYSLTEAWGADFLYKHDRSLLGTYVTHIQERANDKNKKEIVRLLFILQDRIVESTFRNGTLKHGDVFPLTELKTHQAIGNPVGVELTFQDTSTKTIACTSPEHLVQIIDSIASGFARGVKRGGVTPHFALAATARGGDAGGTLAPAETKDMEVMERMRFYPIKKWTHGLLPTDNGPWIELGTNTTFPDINGVLPPPGWVWCGAWHCDDAEGGKEGWMYAIDFPRKFSKKKGMMDYVRQRRWLRSIKRTQTNTMPRARASTRHGGGATDC
jgi:hypothetical protein